MGGTNPYIEKADYELPQAAYTVTFVQPDGAVTTVTVDPGQIPMARRGSLEVFSTLRWGTEWI